MCGEDAAGDAATIGRISLGERKAICYDPGVDPFHGKAMSVRPAEVNSRSKPRRTFDSRIAARVLVVGL
jgi:hypothetical protein